VVSPEPVGQQSLDKHMVVVDFPTALMPKDAEVAPRAIVAASVGSYDDVIVVDSDDELSGPPAFVASSLVSAMQLGPNDTTYG
jgi:hypothetical protein